MEFTITTLAQSLADYLAPYLPNVQMLQDATQQGVTPPCMFLQQRYSTIQKRIGNRYLRQIGLDLAYLLDYNLTDLQQQYEQAAEILDKVMETFTYVNGNNSELIRTYSREWTINEDALHYKFDLQIWVEVPEAFIAMQTLTQNEVIQ